MKILTIMVMKNLTIKKNKTMKKLLLVIALFISMMVSSQTFTKYYDHVIKKDRHNHSMGEWESTNLYAIFSGNEKGDIILYFDNNLNTRAERYYKTGRICNGTSKDGFKFRYIETLNEKKEKVTIQLFDMGVLRIHTPDFTLEYQQPVN